MRRVEREEASSAVKDGAGTHENIWSYSIKQILPLASAFARFDPSNLKMVPLLLRRPSKWCQTLLRVQVGADSSVVVDQQKNIGTISICALDSILDATFFAVRHRIVHESPNVGLVDAESHTIQPGLELRARVTPSPSVPV